MNAEIIAVGSELLTPYRLDTNSLYLTDELNKLGIRVIHKSVVGDSRDDIRETFRHALDRSDLIVGCGGLGPTDDDRTRATVAELLGRELRRNDDVLRGIQERFRRFARTMPEINERQAMVPAGAVVLQNPRGTAPGLWIEAEDHIIILLPGPPAELKGIFAAEVRSRLARMGTTERLFSRDLRVTGLPESEAEQRVRPLYELYPETETTILATPTGIQLHPRIWSHDAAQAEKMLDEIVSRMALALGEHLYSTQGETLEDVVARALTENRATIAVAESCTGGMLAERLTNVPGSSSYFLGGVVCYSNELKSSLVGVPADIIDSRGAVSSETALALADGIRKRTGATLGIGITGIAGPGGGTPEKPVGLVHIAISDERGTRERASRFPGDRERIRFQATQQALDTIRRYFLFPAHGRA
ncbi:MAG TPA: competence/damage-inducible protein A [Candidatus Acidoferrales bacterium]|nr:competence/damage-inducible protein A [Candidatus Acidoferrales bacterium]